MDKDSLKRIYNLLEWSRATLEAYRIDMQKAGIWTNLHELPYYELMQALQRVPPLSEAKPDEKTS